MSKMQNDPLPSLPKPQVEESAIVFDEFLKIRKERLRVPNQKVHNYFSLVTPSSAVSILAITAQGRFVLNAEYRHPTGETLLGTAGGYLGPDEDPLAGAERELLEETGYRAQMYTLLGKAYPYPGISSQCMYYVLASEASKVDTPHLEPCELIQTLERTEEELQSMIASGTPLDGILLAALYLYRLHSCA